MNQRRLGKYELQERLGRNAVDETWKAFDTQQHRYVAIKVIESINETSGEFLSRFNQEAQVVAALHHPNIVQIQEFSLAPNGNEAYIVMDYVEGPSLLDYLDATAHAGKIPSPIEIVHLLTPIAAALDYAHQHRVLHGTLKPTSILFDRRSGMSTAMGEPKITNFGMHQKRDPRLQSLDTVSYTAPEVAQGYAATNRSDLYSLSVLLYELCTGALPFQGETASDILMQHIHSAPTSPALIHPQIRPALTSVIMRGLAREPAARFSSATTLVTAVAKALNVSMPESRSQSTSAYGSINPAAFSASSSFLDTMNSPTSLSPLSQQLSSQALQFPLVPPVVTSSNTPVLTPPPMSVSSNTPVLTPPPVTSSSTPGVFVTPTGAIPRVQPPVQAGASGSIITPQIAVPPPFTSSVRKRRGRGLIIGLVVVLLVALVGSVLATYLFNMHTAPPLSPQTTVVGHAFFVSSGLISNESNRGITDKFQINLQNIHNPQAGKQYYAWLMSNGQIDVPPLALGALPVTHGQATLAYSSPEHNNLLANYGRFLITEEDANQQPTNPSLDIHTWRYYDAFSTTPSPTDPKHYSLLNHLQHLLAQDPKLKAVDLAGGLDTWLFKNTTKVLEAAGSARDQQKLCMANPATSCTDFLLRQVARILDYLDGAAYVKTENIPPTIQGEQLLINPVIARVALLEFDTVHQEPPGYLKHIGTHLQSINQIADSTAEQRALAIRINQAINNVQGWLDAVHADAAKLIHMSSAELLQLDALSTLNDLFNQANAAFVGQVDPNTDNVKEGVVQIHYNIQALATFDVAPCTMNNGHSSCA
ncbi:MAG: hypothetical protein NVS4B11_33790 [Ktedonobacteraceae bacterium]